jgi:hypothetical protein
MSGACLEYLRVDIQYVRKAHVYPSISGYLDI